jgi:hypothetical protein
MGRNGPIESIGFMRRMRTMPNPQPAHANTSPRSEKLLSTDTDKTHLPHYKAPLRITGYYNPANFQSLSSIA